MTEQQRTTKDREKHLYLAFDDWHSGYSIRKVSLSRRSGKRRPYSSGEKRAEPLPPVIMRIQAPRGFAPEYFASAFGNKILLMHPCIAKDLPGIPMIDVKELCLVHGPQPNYNAFPIYFHVGDNKLFVLDFASFHCYLWRPEHSEPWWREDLPLPPFERFDVSFYAVQPDGCVLVSTKSGTTFILDTTEYVWRKAYGNWALPFTGRGYYDTSLEGFVGLSKDPETLGYLHCSTKTSIGDPSIDFKCSKNKVFNMNPAERHVSATILHMRPGRFCVVECVNIDDGRADQEELGEEPGSSQCGGCFMYRVKTFSLGYDAKGDLKLKNCRVRCYNMPQEVTRHFLHGDIAAFWL